MPLNMKNPARWTLNTKIFVILAIIYIALAVILPINPASQQRLNLPKENYVLLLLTLRIPIVAVWFLMYYAYRKLKNYAAIIGGTNEGKHFALIARGIAVLVWGTLVASLVLSLLSSIANVQDQFRITSIIISNYTYLFVTLAAFVIISTGSHRLNQDAKITFTARQLQVVMLALVTVGVAFSYLMSTRLNGSSLTDSLNSFFLPNYLVWSTVILPYLYAWFLGIFAVLELLLVARHSPGIIYKRALQYVALGIVIVLIAFGTLQYYRAIVPRTGSLTLGAALMFTYSIYFLTASGSLLIAKGARQLKRIEEI